MEVRLFIELRLWPGDLWEVRLVRSRMELISFDGSYEL